MLDASLTGVLVDPVGERAVPFTQLAAFGGGRSMPGFRTARLNDRSAAVATVRYSWPSGWRSAARCRSVWATCSANISPGSVQVAGDFRPPSASRPTRIATASSRPSSASARKPLKAAPPSTRSASDWSAQHALSSKLRPPLMSGNSFGQAFRITTAGESHGPGNVVIIDAARRHRAFGGRPARRPRAPPPGTEPHRHASAKEADEPEILAGVFEGRTTGTSIAILVRNEDQKSKDYSDIKDKYRPGHADYTYDQKYGFRDYRGGGRSSARETVSRVAAGVVAKKLLAEAFGARIVGYVTQVGHIVADVTEPSAVTLEQSRDATGRLSEHRALSGAGSGRRNGAAHRRDEKGARLRRWRQ